MYNLGKFCDKILFTFFRISTWESLFFTILGISFLLRLDCFISMFLTCGLYEFFFLTFFLFSIGVAKNFFTPQVWILMFFYDWNFQIGGCGSLIGLKGDSLIVFEVTFLLLKFHII